MMLFEKMNAAMRHSAEEGKKRRELDAHAADLHHEKGGRYP